MPFKPLTSEPSKQSDPSFEETKIDVSDDPQRLLTELNATVARTESFSQLLRQKRDLEEQVLGLQDEI